MNRQTVEIPNTMSKQYIVHNFKKPIGKRLESRKFVGPYYCTRHEPGKPLFFYMRDETTMGDSPVSLRVKRADDVVNLNHNGWYTGEHCDETIFGIVAALPHGRGFLAGWSYGAGMASQIDTDTIHTDEETAAYCADSIAENAAERERDYTIQSKIDAIRDEIAQCREQHSRLAVRNDETDNASTDRERQYLRDTVSDLVEELRALT